jgi:hypothetical protein
MKSRILGLLALGLLAGPVAGQPITVTVDGQQWNVTTIEGTFEDHAQLLMFQPWWGQVNDHGPDAFDRAVGAELGLMNAFRDGRSRGPYFAVRFKGTAGEKITSVEVVCTEDIEEGHIESVTRTLRASVDTNVSVTWAVATRVPDQAP